MIDVNINSHATNKKLDIKKRSIDDVSDENVDRNEVPLAQATVAQLTVTHLKRQVDDLVDNYNKLAKTLNRPQLHEHDAKDTHTKVVSNTNPSLI